MAKILVYDNSTNRMETFYREENQPMPYNVGGSLTVGEFRGSSKSPTLWTTRAAMQSWNRQRELWGSPIPVGYAFKRPWEGGHGQQSQHYAGVSFDVAQGWTNAQRAALRTSARNSGLWSYIEPVSISPTWVHMDKRQNPPACSAGYPLQKQGSKGVYTLILQDELNTLGFSAGGLDGNFGPATKRAVVAYQKSRSLGADGIVGCGTWTRLQRDAVGKGRSKTTID